LQELFELSMIWGDKLILIQNIKYLDMNVENIREYCLKKPEVTESLPFNNTALVFKVNGKMFALLDLEEELRINLKCDPMKAIDLREHYPAVVPGYHMNKRLWNTIYIDGTIEEHLICQWIDDSYRLVIEKMPLFDRRRLLSE
jgi:predicted DNA-binding protein (MmcQ/YjbR family)